jgi:hypothetical protein
MSRNQHIQGNLPGSVRRNLDGTFTVGPFSTVSGGRSAVFENVTVSPGSTFLLGNDNVFSPMPSREAGTTTESNSARSASSAASIEAIRTTVNDLRSQLQNPRLTLEAREALERALRDAEEGLLKAESEPSASQGVSPKNSPRPERREESKLMYRPRSSWEIPPMVPILLNILGGAPVLPSPLIRRRLCYLKRPGVLDSAWRRWGRWAGDWEQWARQWARQREPRQLPWLKS